MLNRNVLLYGSESLPPLPLQLKAGELTVIFEPDTAFLRYIRFGDQEVVRNIYAVVRDQNWNTIPWTVSNLVTNIESDAFEIGFDVDCTDGEVIYAWKGTITGEASGTIAYSFDGIAKSNFLRNRIGICVLHPVKECAGRPCIIEHTSGDMERTGFPQHIAPWQPFRDVASITHEVAPGVRAEVRFNGEVFETEDQRNFGDASFKTYSTPQDLPKPVQIKSGDRVRQNVSVALLNSDDRKAKPAAQGRAPQLLVGRDVLPKPSLGLQISREDKSALQPTEAERLRALGLAHLRADLVLAGEDWQPDLRHATEQARAIGVTLQVALHLSAHADNELAELARVIAADNPPVSLWIISRHGESFPSASTIALAESKLAQVTGKPIAAAASPFFIEMNRNRPAADTKVLPCFPFTPQIHLTDRNTLIENASDIAEMIPAARTFLPQPVVISPITLNRDEAKASVKVQPGTLPPTVDTRQMSLFGAAWTLAHLASLAGCRGVHSATYFETIGWRGVMESDTGNALPVLFPSVPGAVFPVYHVFRDLAGYHEVFGLESTLPLQVVALGLRGEKNARRILAANLGETPAKVQIDLGESRVKLRRMNAQNAEGAMREPEKFSQETHEILNSRAGIIDLTVGSYEVARLDIV